MSGKTLVIIPTVRNPGVIRDYADNALANRIDLDSLFFLILTEDFVDKKTYSSILEEVDADGEVMDQKDRESLLSELHLSEFAEVFPKRSHAETSFGLLYLQTRASEFEFGLLIDDDTKPVSEFDFFNTHITNLSYQGRALCLSSDKRWVNVLHHSLAKGHLYPRGYPYSAMGEKIKKENLGIEKVVASQGLWTNVPDLDSVRILMDGDLNGQARTRLSIKDYGESFTVAKNNYLTVCSMNLAFRKEVVPCFYQFKMDDNPWRIGRFDDIWSGVVLKKVSDSFGWSVLNGAPLCEHNKAPRSTFKDLMSEAPGLEANERFYLEVDKASIPDGDIFIKTERIANTLAETSDDFISYNGKFLLKWVDLIRKVS
ncbi:MAG: alpha-1 4-glucan-protein synthase [Nitrososphaerota archaeon]|nr:alpha-1 4-glucan-protein synthase [Nitrososphaerota archaeon]